MYLNRRILVVSSFGCINKLARWYKEIAMQKRVTPIIDMGILKIGDHWFNSQLVNRLVNQFTM
ncbi:hypothetical protein WR164_04700 [Philodulcilactobacillus myokoensis]|uniref:Uncharacterized protein n=1 Tax=Philodulcilactobacillus myokoensis TaxID=2929573 RepID=A0A9W6ERQ3_9LACO|nr:hypothetical protein WR164_04700 [Philodulcilactobacillus myokoensis]